MKLELKHLAPYLPYKLKFVMVFDSSEDFGDVVPEEYLKKDSIWELYLLTNESIEFFGGECDDYALKNGPSRIANNGALKPILQPLSNLTKEIEMNGEKFVPVEWFEIGDENNLSNDYGFANVRLINHLKEISKYNIQNDIEYLPNGVVNKLHEWHFDVFGLIPKGLAIDINTLITR